MKKQDCKTTLGWQTSQIMLDWIGHLNGKNYNSILQKMKALSANGLPGWNP